MINAHNIYQQWRMVQEHREVAKHLVDLYTTSSYWREIGGLYILCPRQYGKTTALRGFVDRLEKRGEQIVSICPYNTLAEHLDAGVVCIGQKDIDTLKGINFTTYHLVVDEFMFLDKEVKEYLLSQKWKSVTMIGTMI